jgi:hypothetical protein
MAAAKEMVLYYNQKKSDKVRLLKSVFVRMGIRIRNVGPEQLNQTVGALAGLPGFQEESREQREVPVIEEEMMVLYGFGSRRLDELLAQLRRAKVPPVALKAVVTETNCNWTFYELYQEIRAEHEKMTADTSQAED